MAHRKTLPRILIGAAAAVVIVLLVIVVLRQLKKRRADPLVAMAGAATQQFVEDHKTQLRQLDERINSIQALVTRQDRLAPEETVASIQQDELTLLWAHELRGQQRPEFNDMLSGRSYSDLETLEPMLDWAFDPSAPGAYSEEELANMKKALQRATDRYIVVAELREVVLPEITNLDLGSETGVTGEFIAGRTTFDVAVLDTETMEIVACGQGAATNGDTVRAVDGPNQDLWSRTRDAALETARRVMGQAP